VDRVKGWEVGRSESDNSAYDISRQYDGYEKIRVIEFGVRSRDEGSKSKPADPKGRWAMNKGDIMDGSGKLKYTAKQIQEKYALPEVPDMIVDVKPGPGTGVKVGKSGANKWGNGGGRQWEIQVPIGKEEAKWFKNPRALTP